MIITNKTTIDEIKKSAPENSTAIELVLTFNGCDVTYITKTPDQLSNDGITMRDIQGKWIN
jgi:hypothetical protein